jgi:hypothetical protein
MNEQLDPRVQRALDGDLPAADLPAGLRAEFEAAARLLETVERSPVAFSADFDARVMTAVRARASRRAPVRRVAAWLMSPREVRVVVRPWVAGALAAAAVLVLLLGRPVATTPDALLVRDSVAVRFVLHAPGAASVSLAGTFNQWDTAATPLAPSEGGLWAATLVLPAGEHQYAFVVDGERWVPDPAAPGVDDGFGRRNSVLMLSDAGRTM